MRILAAEARRPEALASRDAHCAGAEAAREGFRGGQVVGCFQKRSSRSAAGRCRIPAVGERQATKPRTLGVGMIRAGKPGAGGVNPQLLLADRDGQRGIQPAGQAIRVWIGLPSSHAIPGQSGLSPPRRRVGTVYGAVDGACSVLVGNWFLLIGLIVKPVCEARTRSVILVGFGCPPRRSGSGYTQQCARNRVSERRRATRRVSTFHHRNPFQRQAIVIDGSPPDTSPTLGSTA